MSKLNKAFIRAYNQRNKQGELVEEKQARSDVAESSLLGPHWLTRVSTLDSEYEDAAEPLSGPSDSGGERKDSFTDDRTIQLRSFDLDETTIVRIEKPEASVRPPHQRRSDRLPEPHFANVVRGSDGQLSGASSFTQDEHTAEPTEDRSPAALFWSGTDDAMTQSEPNERHDRQSDHADASSYSTPVEQPSTFEPASQQPTSPQPAAPQPAAPQPIETSPLETMSYANVSQAGNGLAAEPPPVPPTNELAPVSTEKPISDDYNSMTSNPTTTSNSNVPVGNTHAGLTAPQGNVGTAIQPTGDGGLTTNQNAGDGVSQRIVDLVDQPSSIQPGSSDPFNGYAAANERGSGANQIERENARGGSDPKVETANHDSDMVCEGSKEFACAWEIDQLNWPEITNELCNAEQNTLSEVCTHLTEANESGLKSLAVTSVHRGHGGSTVAMCMARTVAKSGLKVALIDADPNGTSLADAFNLDVEIGWLDCVAKGVSFEEAAVHAIDDSISVLPLSGLAQGSRIPLDAFRLQSVVNRLRQSYDFVIVDCDKLDSRTCSLLQKTNSRSIDAAIIVTNGSESASTGVESSVEHLQQSGIESVGIVENFITTS